MKRLLCTLSLVSLVAGALTGFAQNNSPAADAPAVAPTSDTAPAAPAEAPAPAAAEPAAAPASPVVASQDAAPAEATPAAAPADATPAAAPAAAAQPAEASAAPAPAAPAPAPNAAPPSAPVIPLIVMDDVPLTDAIRNLARQAGINYMLDPKIGFGQVGPDGKPGPQPMVSIRWENVTAEQALNALLGNYSLQLIEDPKSKIARVTVKDPAAPDPLVTKIIQLKFTSPSNIVSVVQNNLTDKRSKVVADVRTSQLVVLATEKEMLDVDQLVARLDTQTKQVLIEAKLLETSINPHTSKGVDWTGTLAAQHVTMGNNALQGTPPTPFAPASTVNGVTTPAIPATAGTIGGIVNSPPGVIGSLTKGPFFTPVTAFLNADGVSAVISFLNTYAEAKVISAPRTVTLDNERATIEAGTQYPIINVTAGTANTTGGSSISYSNLTVKLDVTPRISANNFVHLEVMPTATRLDSIQKVAAGSASFDVPLFKTSVMRTVVMIPSGNTLVLGGLIEDNITLGNVKVPLLGDIPGLGYLFRSDTKDRSKKNLVIFITPTIVQDSDYQPTKSEYLKTPVPTKDNLEGDWSAWDSGKPAFSKKDPMVENNFSDLPASKSK